MKASDKPKLIVAGLIFLVAIVLIAYNFGLFGGSAPATPQIQPGTEIKGGARVAPGAK